MLASVLVSFGALLASGSFAQDPGWRERAAREAQRAAEARRAEQIRLQYERRRSAAHARMRLEQDDSSLYASSVSTAETQLSCPALPVANTTSVLEGIFSQRSDGTLLIDIGDGASMGIGPQAAGARPHWWPDRPTPLVQPAAWGPDIAAAHRDWLAPAPRDALSASVAGTAHSIPLLPSASDAHGRQGIAQIRNRSARAAQVRIVAVDDSGRAYGPLRLFVEANGTAEFDSDDVENGNPDKGLYGGTGPGVGEWRLELSSEADIEAFSFVRTWDGVLMPMHDVVASEGTRHRVPIFHPASQWDQESRLRLINPGQVSADVSIAAIDSHGNAPGTGVSVTIPAGASVTYTAAELESGRGAGLSGSLGEGTGAWRLVVDSAQPVQVMNLLSSPTGHLSNLSTVPINETPGVHGVPLLPASSDPSGRQGLVRVVNRADTSGQVHIKAFDDTQWDHAPLVLSLGAGEAVQFDSNDLEQGNQGRGLAGGTGPGEGDWRLELSSELEIEVLSYVRAWDGLLTAMHDIVPGEDTHYRVASFNAQADTEQESLLRLINPGSTPAQVTISGAGSGEVSVTIPAGTARTYTAAELASGEGDGLTGSLGEAAGGRQLVVESGQPLQVMSLLSGPAGRLTNLSTGPVRGVPLPPLVETDTHGSGAETIEDVFGSDVSPIVQAKCVICHVQGGVSGATRLVFVPASNGDHEALNLGAFRDFVEEVDDGANVILNKVQGVAHGGGVQVAAGTEDYANLQRFLGLLGEAVSAISITPETLFDGVTMETPRQTLRRAALVFAGRIPTDAEYAAIQGGDEERLRTTIRGLMTGPEFHEFLIRASNDRLLTDRDGTIIDAAAMDDFVDFANLYHEKAIKSVDDASRWDREVQYGIRRAPLELIAHVAENDLPYTEILTADYIMANYLAADAYGASTTFEDASDLHDFRPSEIVSYYRDGPNKVAEYSLQFGTKVTNPGDLATDYPHAGILNTTVFLKRYPTTATNRNRARSRWTYYHFLGLDIEKSASRTTDPLALADTNNPTMHNPACTVCHIVMDPVAGAFQNYGDEGLYRDQWEGLDSLDEFYKSGEETQTVEVEAATYQSRETVTATLALAPGSMLSVQFANDYWDEGTGDDRNLFMDRLVVRRQNGDPIFEIELEDLTEEDLGKGDCGLATHDTHFGFYGGCRLRFDVDVPTYDRYVVEAVVWADQAGDELAQVAFGHMLYREGDTWYRDMRAPGFNGQLVPDADYSLRWLAERIVQDPRFAEAAVKFWWPAIMGADIAEPPADKGDADFEGLLLASNVQAAEVTRLADGFQSGFNGGAPYNLKDLLVEIVLSRWFRAKLVSGDYVVRTTALQGVGARRLLTPEELAQKTLALTGFQWGRPREDAHPWRGPHAQRWSALEDPEEGYAMLYGGIDSDGVTERARDFTSVMAGVAQAHALQSSRPIIMRELYLLPKENRLLFDKFDWRVSPTFEFRSVFEIDADSASERETVSLVGYFDEGNAIVTLSFINDFRADDGNYLDDQGRDRILRLDRLDLLNTAGDVVERVELEQVDPVGDNFPVDDHFAMHDEGSIEVPVTIPTAGNYTIELVAWADRGGEELAQLRIGVSSNTENSTGSRRIRAKLVDLFDKLHGTQVTADSQEVNDAYELFVEVWERKREQSGGHFLWNEENVPVHWWGDDYFFDGIVDDFWSEDRNEHGHPLGWDWERINPFFESHDWSDPQAVARTWAVVLAYLMMDYRYLYL